VPGGWRIHGITAAAVFVFFSVFSEGGLITRQPWGDVGHFEDFARKMLDGALPYGDFSVEYPPLALPTFLVPALLTEDPSDYLQLFKLEMALVGTAMVFAVAWSLERLRAERRHVLIGLGTVAVSPLLLGHVALNRYDLWPTALTAFVLAAYLARRAALGSGLLAVSFAAKIFAAVAVPIALVRLWRTEGRPGVTRGVVAFAAVAIVIFGYFLVVAFGGLGHSYWIQAKRDLHAESLPASLLLAADSLGVYDATIVAGDPGSLDLSGALPDVLAVVATLATLVALAYVWWAYARVPESDPKLVVAFAAAAAAVLAFSKVLSPQFLTWLLPLVPLVAGRAGRFATAVFVAAMLLTQLELRGWEGLHVDGWAVGALLVRNLLLVVLFALLARELRSPSAPQVAAAVTREAGP
jgi:uncharacterized membrane protein